MESIRTLPDDLGVLKNKANYLVLGGLGFVGKNFLEYLMEADCFEKLVVIDKKLLKLNACIPKSKLEKFADPRMKFLQKDLSKEADVRSVFEEHGPFDYVINLAAETRFDLGEESHKRNTLLAANICGILSAEYKVKKFIQLSSAFVYTSSTKPLKEDAKLEPTRMQAKYSLAAERAIFRIPDLNVIILRPGIIYGPYDVNGHIVMSLAISLLYKMNNEKMMVLWDDDKRMSVVHVRDVVRSIAYALDKAEKGDIFNLANADNMTQDRFFEFIRRNYKAGIQCVGKFKTHLVKLRFDAVIAEMNEKHMRWWFGACQKYGVNNSQLNVMVYREQLEQYDLCIDGSAIKKLGFEYKYPHFTDDDVKEPLKFLIDQNYFPNILEQ